MPLLVNSIHFVSMESKMVETGFNYARKRKKWLLLVLGLGLSGYGVYRVYNSPPIVRKRRRFMKLFRAFVSITDAVSDSAEAIGVVSRELKVFLQSDSDEIPNSLKQIAKIANSREFSESVIGFSRALTVGVSRGYGSELGRNEGKSGNSELVDRVFDKLFSTAGSGFASVVVGSFARNLVIGIYSGLGSNDGSISGSKDSTPGWVTVLCSDKVKELIGDCIQLFVSTAVAVYLDKTMDVNTYDELFLGLTNPKNEKKMKEILVLVCNGVVETLVRTSHRVLTKSEDYGGSGSEYSFLSGKESKWSKASKLDENEILETKWNGGHYYHNSKDGGWVNKMSSTLAVPSNRRLVLDVTGRVASETVRSAMDFCLEKVHDGMKQSVNNVHEAGHEVMSYVSAKSSVIASICLSVCLHVLESPWVFVPQ